MLGEVPEVVKTGVWVGDCFIYTSSLNRLNYYVGGEIITIAHLDRYNACIHVNLQRHTSMTATSLACWENLLYGFEST